MLSAQGTNSDARPARTSPSLVWSWLVVALIAGVFIAACCLPAVRVWGFLPGWMCLTFGVILFPLWLANPILYAGCVFLAAGRYTTAFLLGLAATFLAIFAGVLDVSWGYYLWAGDMALLTTFAGAMSYRWGDRRSARRAPPPEDVLAAESLESAEDIVEVFSGPVVLAELYHQALAEAGIESRVVGLELAAGFGSALPNSVGLWVRRGDAGAAAVVLEESEPAR